MHPRRYLFLICLIAALPPLVFAESDIPGWDKVKWGMPHSEVTKLYELNNWEAGDTPISKLKKRIKIMGHDFGVAFYFDERSANGKLYKVALAHFGTTKTDSAWLYSIKNILVEKYGNPTLFDVKDKIKISMWTKSAGQLKLTTLTDKTVMCAIEYISVRTESVKL
jgi:pterin-4a-carbinolamine dehydratase